VFSRWRRGLQRQRKQADAASLVIQDRGISEEKDEDDGLPDESSAKRKRKKSKKKKAGGAKVIEAQEAGAAAAGVGVEAKSKPPPLLADVKEASMRPAASAAAAEGEAIFMAKFNLSPEGSGSGGQTNGGLESGSVSDEVDDVDDVFKGMDTECKVCMHAPKVKHQVVLYSQYDFCGPFLVVLIVRQLAVAFVCALWAPLCVC